MRLFWWTLTCLVYPGHCELDNNQEVKEIYDLMKMLEIKLDFDLDLNLLLHTGAEDQEEPKEGKPMQKESKNEEVPKEESKEPEKKEKLQEQKKKSKYKKKEQKVRVKTVMDF